MTVLPKGRQISLIGALSNEGMIHWKLVDSSEKHRETTADDFRLFLVDLLPKIPRNLLLIIDNARIHHANSLENIWEMAKGTFGVEYQYLPPYSPFLNPIEYAFFKIKTYVKGSEFYDQEQLKKKIIEGVEQVTKGDAEQWRVRVNQYFRACSQMISFTGQPLNPTTMDEIESIQ